MILKNDINDFNDQIKTYICENTLYYHLNRKNTIQII